MWQAEIVGPWHADRIAQIARDYGGLRVSETTGQMAENVLPDPNLVTTLVSCEAATLAEIEADEAYAVLWSEEIEEEA
jgi:hypothetical protein